MKKKFEWTMTGLLVLGSLIGVMVIYKAATAQNSPLAPAMVATDGSTVVTLFPAACSNPAVTKHIQPEALKQFRSGTVLFDGKVYALCWFRPDHDVVLVVDEDGEHGTLDVRAFKPVSVI